MPMLALTAPVETRWHRIPAAPKLAALAVATVVLLPITALPVLCGAAALTATAYLSQGRLFARYGLRLLRPLIPFLAVLAAWHGIAGDLAAGAGVALKMLTAVALANIVTVTTRLDDMIAVVEHLAKPLARLGLQPHVLAVAIGLVIRFVPVLSVKTNTLFEAWRARSPRRPGWRLVLPVALLALDDAEQVAEALRARGGL
jgi:biotin transport system permease protein